MYAGLILGGVDFEKMGVRGITPQKLISFVPFVNGMMVILVNFLDFVNFFPSFVTIFFSSAFFGGALQPPAYAPDCQSP